MAITRHEFGRRVRTRRKALGITQVGLAEAGGIDHTYLSKIENGHEGFGPSEEVLRLMAATLGVEPTGLILASGKLPRDLERDLLERPPAFVAALFFAMRGRRYDEAEWSRVCALLRGTGSVVEEETR